MCGAGLRRCRYHRGPSPQYEVEGIDRTHMHIPQNQIELIERIAKNKTRGRPAVRAARLLKCHGFFRLRPCELLSGGEAGASAMAQILTGEVNPSGKLAETYPLRLADNPSYHFFSDDRHNVEYRESVYVGYRYYDAAEKGSPLPLRLRASYTTFEYSDM